MEKIVAVLKEISNQVKNFVYSAIKAINKILKRFILFLYKRIDSKSYHVYLHSKSARIRKKQQKKMNIKLLSIWR